MNKNPTAVENSQQSEINELRLLELQDSLAFYKTAPVQDLIKDATVKFDKKDISEIEKCAFD